MSTHISSSAALSSGGGDVEESDIRSQLFASQRKPMQPGSLGSRPTAGGPNPLSPSESRSQPTSAFSDKSSSPVLKAPMNQQTSLSTTADVPLSVSSPLVADGGCAVAGASSSTDKLLEELSRRKTHNVSRDCKLTSLRGSDIFCMRF
jgi:hypothetical protein